MATFTIYNNNEAFGHCGPFDVEAESFESGCELLVGEMDPSFDDWLREQEERWAADVFFNPGLPDLASRKDRLAKMQREFVAGLTEVK